MLIKKRRYKISELLKEDGSAKEINLETIFKVSEVTIRQDLEKLESEGSIRREQGGVFLKNEEDSFKSFTLLDQDNIEKTKIIGTTRVKANPSKYYYLLQGEGPVANSYNVTANHMLFPIPAREMNLNPLLVQNPPF